MTALHRLVGRALGRPIRLSPARLAIPVLAVGLAIVGAAAVLQSAGVPTRTEAEAGAIVNADPWAKEEAAAREDLIANEIAANEKAAAATPPVLRGEPGATASDPANGRYVFIDEARQSSFSINLDRTSAGLGRFSFGVKGLGLFFGDAPAVVEFRSDSSVIVRYDGGGALDRGARLDFVFNVTLASGSAEPAPIRLEAQVNPDRVTSSAQLWFGGVQYKLVDKQPASDPGAALTAIRGALAAQDWAALYDLGYSGFRGAIGRAEFVDRMTAAWAGRGTVTGTAVVAAPILGDRRAGFDAAKATVSFTMTKSGVATTYLADITLLEEPDGWKFLSIPVRP